MKTIKLLILITLISGCVRTYDVTNDASYQLIFKPGQIYITKADLILREFGSKYLAVPGKNSPTVKILRENPGKWKDVRGVVPSGTRIKVTKLEKSKSFEFNTVFIFAEILDGAFRDEIVDLGSVSNFIYENTPDNTSVPIPDSSFIKMID